MQSSGRLKSSTNHELQTQSETFFGGTEVCYSWGVPVDMWMIFWYNECCNVTTMAFFLLGNLTSFKVSVRFFKGPFLDRKILVICLSRFIINAIDALWWGHFGRSSSIMTLICRPGICQLGKKKKHERSDPRILTPRHQSLVSPPRMKIILTHRWGGLMAVGGNW